MKKRIFEAFTNSLRAALFVLIYTFIRFMLFGDSITANDISFTNERPFMRERRGYVNYSKSYRNRNREKEDM